MNDRGHLSATTLDCLKIGGLSVAEKTRVEAHLLSCATCQATQQALEADCRVFEQNVLPRTLDRVLVRARARGTGSGLWTGWRAAVFVVGTAAAAAVLFLMINVSTDREAAVRIKGDPTLRIFAERSGAVFEVMPGVRLRPRDRIRFVVEPAEYRHLLIVSRDGAGQVSLYYPAGQPQSAPIGRGRNELPDSIQLDDAPGPERIVAVFSVSRLAAVAVLEVLRVQGDKPPTKAEIAGAGFVVTQEFDKEVP